MPVWLVRGSEHIAADDRETLAHLVGAADAAAAKEVAKTDAEEASGKGDDGGSRSTADGDKKTKG